MAKKLYLSAAAHASDNPTACPGDCSENTHCNQYMDLLEARMKALGIQVRRGARTATGTTALTKRVREANSWGADLYYVAHTNAGGGRYSMTMCWGDALSRAKAKILHKYRTCLPEHRVVARQDLYEIRATAMLCLYDELFFHDNAEDCAWFHNGGMEQMVEETVKGLCQILGTTYKKPVKKEKPIPVHKPGERVTLNKGRLYVASTGTASVRRTGTFYLYDGKAINGRYRVTNRKSRVGKKPVALHVSGWVNL